MPISSFLGLETSLRGLNAQQRALDVTGHNISNANTEGYTRQTAEMKTTAALSIQGGGNKLGGGTLLGTGVDVTGYARIRDQFLDVQFRAQSMSLGDSTARSSALTAVEGGLNEPGDSGISAQLNAVYSSWSDLANAPDSAAARQSVIDKAKTLATSVKTLDGQFASAQTTAASERADLLKVGGKVQSAALELSSLNDQIAGATARGAAPNDLLDRRDQLLDQLSSMSQIRVTDTAGRPGAVTVFFGDVSSAATPLVDGATPGTNAVATWPVNVPAGTGGQLGALADLADTSTGTIAQYRQSLNSFAKTLADAVNTAYTANGTVSGNFLTYTAGSEASSLAVDSSVNLNSIHTTNTSTAGANDIALAVADLRAKPAPVNGADAIYTSMVSKVGNDVQSASQAQTNQQTLVDSITDRRQSVGGVSLDQEMTNLIRFQRGYQASARAMSTMDEMLDVLINRTGKVGL